LAAGARREEWPSDNEDRCDCRADRIGGALVNDTSAPIDATNEPDRQEDRWDQEWQPPTPLLGLYRRRLHATHDDSRRADLVRTATIRSMSTNAM
jgi:hypothetical protein